MWTEQIYRKKRPFSYVSAQELVRLCLNDNSLSEEKRSAINHPINCCTSKRQPCLRIIHRRARKQQIYRIFNLAERCSEHNEASKCEDIPTMATTLYSKTPPPEIRQHCIETRSLFTKTSTPPHTLTPARGYHDSTATFLFLSSLPTRSIPDQNETKIKK